LLVNAAWHPDRGWARHRMRRPTPTARGSEQSSFGVIAGRTIEHRRGRGREDIVGVRRIEVDRAVDLEDVAAAAHVAGDVDAGKVEPKRGDCPARERSRGLGRIDTSADGAQSDVRPPFARQGTALDRADHLAAGDEEAQVAARRLDK
jgi:hypothetical protein